MWASNCIGSDTMRNFFDIHSPLVESRMLNHISGRPFWNSLTSVLVVSWHTTTIPIMASDDWNSSVACPHTMVGWFILLCFHKTHLQLSPGRSEGHPSEEIHQTTCRDLKLTYLTSFVVKTLPVKLLCMSLRFLVPKINFSGEKKYIYQCVDVFHKVLHPVLVPTL